MLGCSDSRVPAEIVFDQGLGDLFVIRVAGNIVAPSQIGSVEFAAEQFHTRLVVVLGHSGCGAILATIEQLKRPVETQSRNLRAIVDRVRPSVEPLLATPLRDDPASARAAMPCAPTCARRRAICATARRSWSSSSSATGCSSSAPSTRSRPASSSSSKGFRRGGNRYGARGEAMELTATTMPRDERRLKRTLALLGGFIGIGYLYVGRIGYAVALFVATDVVVFGAAWAR